MNRLPLLAAVIFLHAIVWQWMKRCIVNRFPLNDRRCPKKTLGCIVDHGSEAWEHPHGRLCVPLGLINPHTGDPNYDEMQRGWV